MGTRKPGTIVVCGFPSRWVNDCAAQCITHLLKDTGIKYSQVRKLIIEDKVEDEAPDRYSDAQVSRWMRSHLTVNTRSTVRILSRLTGEPWGRFNILPEEADSFKEYAEDCAIIPRMGLCGRECGWKDYEHHIAAVKYGVVYDTWDSRYCKPDEVILPGSEEHLLPFFRKRRRL